MDRLRLIGLAALTLTAVAVWGVELRDRRWEPASHPERLADVSQLPGTATFETMKLGSDHLMFAWTYGELDAPAHSLDYLVLRSERPSTLAVSWVLKLERPLDPLGAWGEERDVDGVPILVHWIEEAVGNGIHFAARTEVLGCKPTDSLMRSQILSAPRQLIHGTLPLSVYVVDGVVVRHDQEKIRRVASDWLVDAVRHHLEVCAS